MRNIPSGKAFVKRDNTQRKNFGLLHDQTACELPKVSEKIGTQHSE